MSKHVTELNQFITKTEACLLCYLPGRETPAVQFVQMWCHPMVGHHYELDLPTENRCSNMQP